MVRRDINKPDLFLVLSDPARKVCLELCLVIPKRNDAGGHKIEDRIGTKLSVPIDDFIHTRYFRQRLAALYFRAFWCTSLQPLYDRITRGHDHQPIPKFACLAQKKLMPWMDAIECPKNEHGFHITQQ